MTKSSRLTESALHFLFPPMLPDPIRTIRLTVASDEGELQLTFRDDITAGEFLMKCELLALAVGFSPETWHDALLTKADELEPRNPTL